MVPGRQVPNQPWKTSSKSSRPGVQPENTKPVYPMNYGRRLPPFLINTLSIKLLDPFDLTTPL